MTPRYTIQQLVSFKTLQVHSLLSTSKSIPLKEKLSQKYTVSAKQRVCD